MPLINQNKITFAYKDKFNPLLSTPSLYLSKKLSIFFILFICLITSCNKDNFLDIYGSYEVSQRSIIGPKFEYDMFGSIINVYNDTIENSFTYQVAEGSSKDSIVLMRDQSMDILFSIEKAENNTDSMLFFSSMTLAPITFTKENKLHFSGDRIFFKRGEYSSGGSGNYPSINEIIGQGQKR